MTELQCESQRAPRAATRQNLCAALATLAVLEGCSALEPCDHRDLEGHYGLLCALRGVETRSAPRRDAQGFLVGSVSAEAADGPIVVFAYRKRATVVDVAVATTLSQPGPYRIAVPAGLYRIAAFEDDDEDLRYDPARERAALYHDGGIVAVRSGESVDRLYLRMRDDRPQRLEFDFALPESAVHACCDMPPNSALSSGTTRQ